MKMLYLSLKMILRQKYLNLFLMVTILLSISYLSPVLSQAIHYAASSQSLAHLDMEQAYYLYKNPHYSRRGPDLHRSVAKKVCELDYVLGHAEAYNLPAPASPYDVIGYNDVLIEKFVPEMDSGIWLGDAELSACIPAVVSGDLGLKSGDTFSLELTAKDVQHTFSCQVVGTLKQGTDIVGFSGAADNDYFTADALLRDSRRSVIVPLTGEIAEFTASEAYLLSAPGSILYTLADTTYSQVQNDFGYAGIVAGLDAGNHRLLEQSKLVAAAMGAYFVLYLFITFICILCSSFIFGIGARRIYTIYFLTGMSKAGRITIEIMRCFLLILSGTALSFLYIRQSGALKLYFGNADSCIVLAAVLLYVSLIFIPVSAGLIIRSQKSDIMDSVRSLNTEI